LPEGIKIELLLNFIEFNLGNIFQNLNV